jgi:hypothetical protein
MTTPEGGLIRRSFRRFSLGSGPLKRRSDRVQMVGRFLVALSLVAAPLIAVAVATDTTAHLEALADAEAAERSRTTAVLLEDAGPLLDDSSDPSASLAHAEARWTVPGGTSRVGIMRVAAHAPAGTSVTVWVDEAGNLTGAPFDRASISSSVVVTAGLALIGLPLVTWTLYATLCFALDARRDRRWEQDWATVEPVWNSRLL